MTTNLLPTNEGEILRESTVEPLPKTVTVTTPVVMETVRSYVGGQRSLEGILLAVVVCVVGWLLARHYTRFITLLATPT
jgi:hypothetical protein